MKLFVPVAVAALALMSCQREAGNFIRKSDNQKAVTIVVKAAAEELVSDEPVDPADSEETRTYIDNTNTIIWGTGEYMKLALTAGENTTFANSTDASADTFDGDAEAMFAFSVTPETASEYVYQGLYPASAAATSNNNNAANYKVNLPAIQNATATSYDPAAYIMVAKPESFTSVQTEWEASFRRGTALNKITLKNVPDGVSISKVKITAEGKKLAGGRHFNLTTGEGLEVYGTDATIEVLYATALSGTNVDVWFTTWNAEIAAGEKLTIVAYTTDSKSYTKEITARAGGIKFQEGYLNTLGASLSGIDPETVATIDGDFVILAKHNTSYYALKGEASGTHIASVDYNGSITSFEGDASIIWTITPSGSSYTIKNGSNYLGWTSGNAADLVDEADYDATKCLMGIEAQGNDIYHINVQSDPTRILARNTGSAFFAFYASTGQYSDIVLVPATALEVVATPTFNPAAGEVTSGTEVTISSATDGATIYYTIDGTDPTTSSTQGTSVTITGATTIKAIAVKDGMANSEIATATYTVAGETPTTGWIETAITDLSSGDVFVIVANGDYAMSTSGGSSTNPPAVAVVVSGTTLTGTISDAIKWNITGNATNGYTFYPYGETTKLFCNTNASSSSNTNLRIGAGGNYNRYVFEYTDGNQLVTKDDYTDRYIGINGTSDFRGYVSASTNKATFKFYKYVAAPDTRTVVTMWFDDAEINRTTDDYSSFYGQDLNIDPMDNPVMNNLVWSFDNNDNVIDETNSTGEEIALTGNPGTATVSVSFAGDDNYKPASASYTITVTSTVTSYDFETVAELNALANPGGEKNGYLTGAVVSYVNGKSAIIKDATASILLYKDNHNLLQGQTFTGALTVTITQYNSCSELTACDASFTGTGSAVAPENVTLAQLVGNLATYQNAYVKVDNLTVTEVSGKNITVTDDGGVSSYVIYSSSADATCSAGDVLSVVGTIAHHGDNDQIKVWATSDITVTASAPKAITFSQPAAGGSFTVTVGGNSITSGTTATAATDYTFNGWTVNGATVADASASTTTFVMGASAVTVSASFISNTVSGPTSGDVLFSTDFGSSAVALSAFTGGTSYNNASNITYTASNTTYVKIDTGTAGNMSSANLFIGGKNGGSGLTATIAGIKTYGATSVTVTWAANNANSRVSITESSSAAVTSANNASNSATFTLSGNETTITLVFTGTAASNTRVDNVSVVYN